MSLTDLTSSTAVEKALQDFDQIGREAFLRKYGFGKAQKYFLVQEGRRYDSKAIAAVAHGYQFPEFGPLTSANFSGGENTVAKKLRSLGFEIIQASNAWKEPSTWVFCANPKRYDIQSAVRHLTQDYWTIGRSDVRKGDRAAIWQTLDKAGNRGIVAFAEVLSDPENTSDVNPFWKSPHDGTSVAARVLVAYETPQSLPLWVDNSQSGAFLQSLSVAKAQGGTVFRLSTEEWDKLTQLCQYVPISSEAIELEEQIHRSSKPSCAQGFGLKPAERKAVELYAMEVASNFFKATWTFVEDVSAKCSYDLLCRRGLDSLTVEVKGTTGKGDAVILTRKEVEHARTHNHALFVVSEIKLSSPAPGEPEASGGIARFYSPWIPEDSLLTPLSYQCNLKVSDGELI